MSSPVVVSHLSVLETSASLYTSAPVFQVPCCDPQTGEVEHWKPVSYSRFKDDVDRFAREWTRILKADGIPPRSIIGMWLSGMTYTDVVHIYGMSRAGYVPQLFSVRLPNPVVVFELLSKAKASALVFEPSFKPIVTGCPVPSHDAFSLDAATNHDEPLPPLHAGVVPSDTALIFHTSGSTSGSPKLVPCSYTWVQAAIEKSHHVAKPLAASGRDVTVWMGSMSHIGQSWMLLGSLQHGACTIQPSKIAFSSSELAHMVHECGLNRLNQFATFLAGHIRNACVDPKVAALLRSFDQVLYSGLPLAAEAEKWAYENSVRLKNLFGSTEVGAMMVSQGGNDSRASLLEPLPGTVYEFRPLPTTAAASETGHQTTTGRMLELIIHAESGDCPDASLRAPDGQFHTGDLFIEPEPGRYISRGRDDDWIKSENSLRCDTKAIEDNVLKTCADLVEECIVVGSGRPSPVLFVEPKTNIKPAKLQREILRRTRAFHERRYLHERITEAKMIVVVNRGALPRTATKGNIRRKATEDVYKALLDQIFS
ncbi:acetyl-CoA synthetase-like protein [Vararia minispora EC-137]|uniref:Acetyl-CoA synthetase-like protein n=1 Tax=Vararia minispora EC-137 TaxID=1314806 RepID=A0ACB8QRT1_9AGAM|nr:acetyl-CoA synthetase-like protein [Vararia minispora EC-137]